MEKRRSIDVAGARHVNPIPSASRIGPFVVSGAISGADPATGKVPEDLDAQCAAMFANVRRVIETAGGTPDDIIKMNVDHRPRAPAGDEQALGRDVSRPALAPGAAHHRQRRFYSADADPVRSHGGDRGLDFSFRHRRA